MWVASLVSLFGFVHSLDIVGVSPAVPNRGPARDEVTIIQHSFGNSYGSPATAQYTPPSFDFTHVQLELDLSSSGNQYDRLIHIYLENVEVWRPSTPEPGGQTVNANMSKDVSQYLALFKQSGTFTFQLDNVQDSSFTGAFDCTLKIRYFNPGHSDTDEMQWYYSDTAPTDVKAVQSGILATTPPDTSLTIPKVSGNTYRIGLSIFATGNSDEEFFYSNSEDSSGPTRIVQLFINNQLAGFVDPFQPIFTGGMQPHLWYPIVGVNTYDAPSHYVDLSPWLPVLWQQETKVEVKVVNGYNGNEIRSNWLINAALMEWQDKSLSAAGGSQTTISNTSSPATYLSKDVSNGHIGYVGLYNTVECTSDLHFSDGSTRTVSWKQSSTARNAQLVRTGDNHNFILSYQKGSCSFSSGSQTYSRNYEFPLAMYFGTSSSIALDQSYIIANQGGTGVSSVNNNIKAGWGDGEPNQTNALCSWTDNGSSFTRAASAQNNLHLSDSTSQSGASSFGSLQGMADNLQTLAHNNDNDGFTSAMSGYANQYSTGTLSSRDALGGEDSEELPSRCPPQICRRDLKAREMPFRCPPSVCPN